MKTQFRFRKPNNMFIRLGAIATMIITTAGCSSVFWLSGLPYDFHACTQTKEIAPIGSENGENFRLVRYFDYKTWCEGDGYRTKFLRTRFILLKNGVQVKKWTFDKPMKGELNFLSQNEPGVNFSKDQFVESSSSDSCR